MNEFNMVNGQESDFLSSDSFWPDVELYNNQGPIGDISTYSPRPEETKQRAEKEDHRREQEWLEYFTRSSESNASTLACTKSEETSMDEVYLCIEQVIHDHIDTQTERMKIEIQKMEADEQKMEYYLEEMRIRHQIKAVKKAKEQAELKEQMGKST